MTFLNTLLLGGALAFTVPLIIHLFHRSRFRVVPWGAMHLLESVVRINRRRFRIEQLILLLVRCAIPVVLALCMAQPLLTRWRATVGDAPVSLAVLLDDSYSMQAAADAGGNFQRAVSHVSQLLQRLPRGSEATVVTMGQPKSVLDAPTYDLQQLSQRLAAARAEAGPIRPDAALETAMSQLDRTRLSRAELIVISDFQRTDWQAAQSTARWRELLDSSKVHPELTLWQLPEPSLDNVSVQAVEPSRYLVGVNQQVIVRALVRNHGRRAYEDLHVSLRVDETAREVSQIPLEAGADAHVLFRCTLDRPGSHVIAVEAESDDLLRVDNQLAAVVSALDQLGVLVINGDASPQPLRGETDFLEIALQPFQRSGDKLADLIQPRVVEPSQFGRASLEDVRVVVLANVPKLTDLQVAALDRFVRGGGGLLVFAGNRLDTAWYNRVLAEGPPGLLPMRFAALAGNPADPAAQTAIVSERFQHPALDSFNDRRNGNVADGRISMWYQLQPVAQSAESPRSAVSALAKLSAGDPLMVEYHPGNGCVIQMATACDADWSNLPMRPFYLPLMQQLVLYLASAWEPPRNVELQQPLVAVIDRENVTTVSVADPAGQVHEIRPAVRLHRAVAEYPHTEVPGRYVMRADQVEPMEFMVTAPRRESALDTLPSGEIQQLATKLGGSVVRSLDEYTRRDEIRRHGQPLWKPLWFCVVALLFGELLLQYWLSRDAS